MVIIKNDKSDKVKDILLLDVASLSLEMEISDEVITFLISRNYTI
jgi:molecular chaperone DnaK (HSP70)